MQEPLLSNGLRVAAKLHIIKAVVCMCVSMTDGTDV